LVVGAIAASAPVFWFKVQFSFLSVFQNFNFKNAENPPFDAFDKIVTRTFRLSGCSAKSVVKSFSSIRELAQSGSSSSLFFGSAEQLTGFLVYCRGGPLLPQPGLPPTDNIAVRR
jgi:hypothetical protein